MKILEGTTIAKKITKKLIEKINLSNTKPRMTIIQVGDLAASNKYIKYKIKKGEEIGIEVSHIKVSDQVSESDLIKIVRDEQEGVHGLIVQLPLPKHINKERVLNSIEFEKDIDGLSKGNNLITPATPKGIILLLDEYQINVIGKKVSVVGQSPLVGLPLSNILELNGAIVKRHNLLSGIDGTEDAEILIVAAGSPNLIKKNNIKEGVLIIDVGINTLSNQKVVGDVDRKSIGNIPSAISPVFGGVGPMTVISLFINLIETWEKQMLNS